MCVYEDEKNQKILVGYGLLTKTNVLFTITPNSSQQSETGMQRVNSAASIFVAYRRLVADGRRN